MRILLDTNIIIHREASRVVRLDTGLLFNWLDRLKYDKIIHPITRIEIERLPLGSNRDTMLAKLDAYQTIIIPSALHPDVQAVSSKYDTAENDISDTQLLNEIFTGRADILVSEDRKISTKAQILGIKHKVFTITELTEKLTAENPDLTDYKIKTIKKEYFGKLDISDTFFDTFRRDYLSFNKWFNKKSDETAYVSVVNGRVLAFLYIKVEGSSEPYNDIHPNFLKKKRLKIGTFKVQRNGVRIGERLLKIAFDNAIRQRVDEVYVTIFDNTEQQRLLISLFREYGFMPWGYRLTDGKKEQVYVRSMIPFFDTLNPKLSYPFMRVNSRTFLVPIYPDYHTNLFPDSILTTESPIDFEENAPFRNAISKIYVSHSLYNDIRVGDNLIFYRTGGLYKSVVTTVGVVTSVHKGIKTLGDFIDLCRTRTVFSQSELLDEWKHSSRNRPFIVNFLYNFSFPKRINMKTLIDIGVIPDVESAPRGFTMITTAQFNRILQETQTDDRFAVNQT